MKQVTITLTRYKEPNRLLFETLFSLAKQTGVEATILMLDQQDDEETKKYCAELTTSHIVFVRKKIEPIGLSYARNQAIALTDTDILLCIDADACPEQDRAYELALVFDLDPKIGLVGGKILPRFHKEPPFLIKANVIYDMYSLLDRGEQIAPCEKVVGASYGLHKIRLGKEAYLEMSLGRRPGVLLGGEETELCIRAKSKGLVVYYTGKAVVYHQILPERLNYRRIMKRVYRGGYSRAMQGGSPKASSTRKSWWNLFIGLLIAPIYITGYVTGRWQKRSLLLVRTGNAS